MAMSCRLMFALVLFATTATGSRLKPVFQHADTDRTTTQGSHIWKKDKMYFCIKKWEKSSGYYQDKWCLAEMEDVMKGTEKGAKKMMASKNLNKCVAKSKDWRFKVCNLKGKLDRRLNYAEKVYVPKSCFAKLPQEQWYGGRVPILQSAVTYQGCVNMYGLPPQSQKRLTKYVEAAKVEEVTTTTMSDSHAAEDEEVTTTTSEPERVDEDALDDTETDPVPDEIQKILAEDQERDEEVDSVPEAQLDLGKVENEKDPVDNIYEDSLESDEGEYDRDTSGEMDVDELNAAEIRELWKRREAINRVRK